MKNRAETDFYLINSTDYYNTPLKKANERELYKDMITIREMELLLKNLFIEKRIRGFCHLVIGQEAIYAALKHVLQGDKVVGSYRCHGLAYASGISVQEIVCELLGKVNGNCKGKGGSMHLYNETFYGGHGIVGAQVPIGTGVAYALKYKNTNNVCYTFFGDGAANQGQVFESFNMAKLWNLPVVFVCENNFYSMWTPQEDSTTNTRYFERGINIPGIRINGNDIDELIRAFTYSREFAKVNGPIIIQIDTYRTCEHSCIDKDDFYRKKSEIEEMKNQDGLSIFKERLTKETSAGVVSEIEEDVQNFILSVKNIALNSEDPPASDLYSDIISE
nr:unnamed protein product [Papilio xuthus]